MPALAFRAHPVEDDGQIGFRKAVNVLECPFDAFEEIRVASVGFAARLANEEVVDLSIQEVLVDLPFGEGEFLDDFEPFQGFQIPVNTGAIDARQEPFHRLVKFLEGDLATFIVENELEQDSTSGRNPHPVGP